MGNQRIRPGADILLDPTLNKGTAFTEEERDALHLRGLLPPHVSTIEEQARRNLRNFRLKTSDLEKYIFLSALHDRNETLFYYTVMQNIREMMPIVYTPTVGEACSQFAHIFRRTRGLYVTANDRGRVASVLRNWPVRDVRVIVITDGERILGLGDLGANGMGIPIGKLTLYTACAGIPPEQCLPVMLDAGTENDELRSDPLYLGLRRHRLRGAEYDDLVEEFFTAAADVFPHALIQFEDFANRNAFRLLERYRDRACTFNDDIQGTAAVALAGLQGACRLVGEPLSAQRILFFGAGSAALGIADLIASARVREGATEEDARRSNWLVDSKGLVVAQRDDLAEQKRRYAHDHAPRSSLLAAVEALRPTALVGVSGQPWTFTREVVTAMSAIRERPIIFALSNPTSRAECTAEEAYRWSDGRAVFASGSPFASVERDGRTLVPGQGNNAYIFPGLGLGVLAARARRVSDAMFLAAAEALAGAVDDADLEQGCVYPRFERIREVSAAIAVRVAEVAYEEGLAEEPRPADLRGQVASLMYEPMYRSHV